MRHGSRLRSTLALCAGALAAALTVTACTPGAPTDLFGTPQATSVPLPPTATATPRRTPTPVPVPSPRPTATLMPTPTALANRPVQSRPSPTPTNMPSPTPVPELASLPLYTAGKLQPGFSVDSWNFPLPDAEYEGRIYNGSPTLSKNLFVEGDSGEFMSVYSLGGIDLAPYTHVRFTATSMSGPGAWISVTLAVEPFTGSDMSEVVYVPPGSWATFTVPIEDLLSPGYAGQYVGVGFSGEPGPAIYPNNAVAFADVRLVNIPDVVPPWLVAVQDVTDTRLRVTFSEEVKTAAALDPLSYTISSVTDSAFARGVSPSQVVPQPSGRTFDLVLPEPVGVEGSYRVEVRSVEDLVGNGAGLSVSAGLEVDVKQATIRVNALQDVNPFSPKMRGVAMNTWNWIYGGLENYNSPKRAAVLEAAKQIEPGIVRFAGGLWVNGTGWDRSNAAPADGNWTFTDPVSGTAYSYTHTYRASLIDSYAAFVKELGAETVMQVNICDNNPDMWADLVRYTNIDHDYGFKYWELGNEMDLDQCVGEQEYVIRFIEYSKAMKAVDPSIKIMGPVPSMPYHTSWYNAVYAQTEASLDVLSFHWYQLTEWTTNSNAFGYQGGSIDALLSYNRAVGTNCNDGFGCPGEVVPSTRLDRITYRRAMPESVEQNIIARYESRYPDGEVAITEMGPHASLHEHPINGNHLAALWLADIIGRWAYNGLDILTYYSLEDGGTGVGNTRGLVGIDDDRLMDVRPTFYTEWLYAEHFGNMMVSSMTSDEDQEVLAWASRDTANPDVLKLILINLSGERAEASLEVSGFTPSSGEMFVMSSTDPTSIANPDSFANHQTTVNGVQIPDVPVNDPAAFTRVIESIEPVTIEAGSKSSYSLEPYSVVAVTLYR